MIDAAASAPHRRADDMIVSGDGNVHPGPVGDLIAVRLEMREAAVTSVPDNEYGPRLAAYVVREPGAAVDADAVRGWVNERLSRFAVPRGVRRRPATQRHRARWCTAS
ncbi:MAG: hypothetical protein L0H64_19830 [Pseudonocardia sp.]|nr:hypothetical protein [Pseudonocardia sp.]